MIGRLFSFLSVTLLSTLIVGQAAQVRADVPVPQTYSEAMRWYRNAAEAGDPKAMFYLGLTLEQGLQSQTNPERALLWYRRSADAAFALAQFKMGQLYQFGQLVDRDPEQARGWYRKASDQGLADAQYNLAVMLETGEGGEVDGQGAVALYLDAARNGIPEAFLNLGGLYAQGDVVEQDLVDGLKWLILAQRASLSQGDPMAASIRQLLNAVEMSDAESRADRWQRANASAVTDSGS